MTSSPPPLPRPRLSTFPARREPDTKTFAVIYWYEPSHHVQYDQQIQVSKCNYSLVSAKIAPIWSETVLLVVGIGF